MHSPTRRTFLRGLSALAIGALPGTIPLAAATTLPTRAQPNPRELAAIADIAAQFMRRFAAPGLSIAVARHGRMVLQEGFGYADVARRERLSASHLFRIASVSKPITSAAIFTLVEQGAIGLSERVFGPGGLLPFDLEALASPPYLRGITVHHLLTHTVGGWGNRADDPVLANPAMSHRVLIEWALRNHRLSQPPGLRFQYSNFGYCLLGRVIEQATGLPYAEAATRLVLGRCGISGMRLAGNTRAERAVGEVEYLGQHGENPYSFNARRLDANGGWLATPSDLVRFAMHVDGFDTTPNILSPATIKTMTTPSICNESYACGWAVNRVPNWWHIGLLPGMCSILVRTASGLCWAAVTNTRANGIEREIEEMMWRVVRAVPAWRA